MDTILIIDTIFQVAKSEIRNNIFLYSSLNVRITSLNHGGDRNRTQFCVLVRKQNFLKQVPVAQGILILGATIDNRHCRRGQANNL